MHLAKGQIGLRRRFTFINACTADKFPISEAACKAVTPPSAFKFGSAPFSKSASTVLPSPAEKKRLYIPMQCIFAK